MRTASTEYDWAAGRKGRSSDLDHDPMKLNRDHGLAFCLRMIFFRKPVPTLRDHALGWRSHTSGKVDLLQARLIVAASLGPTIVENVQEPHRAPIGARS